MPSGPFPNDVNQRFDPDGKTVDDRRQYNQSRDGVLYATHRGIRSESTDKNPKVKITEVVNG